MGYPCVDPFDCFAAVEQELLAVTPPLTQHERWWLFESFEKLDQVAGICNPHERFGTAVFPESHDAFGGVFLEIHGKFEDNFHTLTDKHLPLPFVGPLEI